MFYLQFKALPRVLELNHLFSLPLDSTVLDFRK